MNKKVSYLVMSLLLVALATTLSFAQGKDRSGTFSLGEDDQSYYLNGTLVDRGNYRIKYDGDTGMITIKHEGDLVATVKPRIVMEAEKSPYDAVTTRQIANGIKLVSVRFDGDRRTFYIEQENLVVNDQSEDGR
jgi:hypothetical protein